MLSVGLLFAVVSPLPVPPPVPGISVGTGWVLVSVMNERTVETAEHSTIFGPVARTHVAAREFTLSERLWASSAILPAATSATVSLSGDGGSSSTYQYMPTNTAGRVLARARMAANASVTIRGGTASATMGGVLQYQDSLGADTSAILDDAAGSVGGAPLPPTITIGALTVPVSASYGAGVYADQARALVPYRDKKTDWFWYTTRTAGHAYVHVYEGFIWGSSAQGSARGTIEVEVRLLSTDP